MKYKIKDYTASRPEVLKMYEKRGINGVTELCAVSGVPIVIACYYILEYNEDSEVRSTMERLMDYFGVGIE